MDTTTLRAVQAPIKDQFREDAASARVTLVADGELDGDGLTCSVQTGRALVEAGLHPATGGDELAACSGDMLLQALVACAGVTLRAVATALGVELRGGSVHAEGDLDFRGTLGVDKQAPVGFSDIRLSFDLGQTDLGDSEADMATRAALLTLTERYCVVLQTLRTPARIAATLT